MEKQKIAVLIDGDNAQPKLLEGVIKEVSKYGSVTIRHVYGDWTQSSMNGWKSQINSFSFTPMQKFAYTTGKNSTDSALIISAMDILHTKNVNGFCIVSSDSDYTGLATRIREEGIFVMGIGEKKTPEAFVRSCEIFIYTENLYQNENVLEKRITKNVKNVKIDKKIVKLIDEAFDISLNEGETEVYISTLGANIRKLDSSFDVRTYKHKKLTDFLEELRGYEIVKKEVNGKNNPLVKKTSNKKSL